MYNWARVVEGEQPSRPDGWDSRRTEAPGGLVRVRSQIQTVQSPSWWRFTCPVQVQGVSLVFLNQDRTFLCRRTSQLGNPFYVLLLSCTAARASHDFICWLLSLSLSSPLWGPCLSLSSPPACWGKRQHDVLILAHLGWTFNPSTLLTPSMEPALAPGI